MAYKVSSPHERSASPYTISGPVPRKLGGQSSRAGLLGWDRQRDRGSLGTQEDLRPREDSIILPYPIGREMQAAPQPAISLVGLNSGEVSERLKEHAWKACIRQRIEGSNPSLSAIVFPKSLKTK